MFSQTRIGSHLEDHPRTCTWLITMVIRIGLWDPFQMTMAYKSLTNWDDPVSRDLGVNISGRHDLGTKEHVDSTLTSRAE